MGQTSAEYRKAEEAATESRRTKQGATLKIRRDFSDEEARRAQISRDRKVEEIAKEQEAQRGYQEQEVGFFDIEKVLAQSPPCNYTSTGGCQPMRDDLDSRSLCSGARWLVACSHGRRFLREPELS